MRPFQIILLAVFGFLAVAGLIAFATFKGFSGNGPSVGTVVIWGTLPASSVNAALDDYKRSHQSFGQVSYVEEPAESFESALADAIASGRGPALILISQEQLLAEESRLAVIPESSISERAFRGFLPESELFLTEGGIGTTLIHHEGVEIPHFATFALLATPEGTAHLRRAFRPYAENARRFRAGIIVDSNTWRGSRDWGAKLGYDRAQLAAANRAAIALLEDLRGAQTEGDSVMSGVLATTKALERNISAIQSLESDIRLMGLNTTLRSGRLGNEGRALTVIAQELRTCSNLTATEADADLTFAVVGDYASGHEVELVQQLNGNLKERPLDPALF